ncbi:MAG: FimB/Mfa2 family fimbrial subunit, partial [Odoribacteraceae bacterium]|nr:FimB/Mfa2 family fimbrial subunit [Odoribacteraceae bacterium]
MKQVNAKGTNSCLQAGTPQENTRPENRCSGQRSRFGRATIPYIVTRLFSCLHVKPFVLAVIMAFSASCVTNINESNPSIGDGEHLVTLSFTVPGAPTRAMDESTVETIDVLLFDQTTDQIVYRAIGTTPSAGQFTVKLPANTYHIVVLANARAMIPVTYPPATTDASFTNDTRDIVLAAITKSIAPVTSHQWPTTFDRIPMWGYSNGFVVGTSSPTIGLTRMIAKVDIDVDGAVTNFWLANVRLYNYSTAGHIAPAALPPTAPAGDRYDGYDITQWDDRTSVIKAYAPHLPAGVKATDDYLAYLADPSDSRDIIEYKNNIYALETSAGVAYPTAGWKQNTCLIIGGYYQSTAFPTYYRVEFANTTDGHLPLLRNHKYSVTITGVSAPGYPTPEDAYNNPPSNIAVQITEWNDAGLNDVTFNDQHYLAVDKSELTFYAGGAAKSMEAITDFPTGWTVDANALPAWLTITAPVPDGADIAHGLTNVKTTLTLTAGATSSNRSDEFHIVAGNLRKKIIVTQTTDEEFSLVITDLARNPISELVFDAGSIGEGTLPAARSFLVTWFPADEDCQVQLTTVAGMTPFTFNTSGIGIDPSILSTLSGGEAMITIQPDAMSPGDPDPTSRLDFFVTSGAQYRMASINLRQINNYVITESVAMEYLADGTTTYFFTVKSNVHWSAIIDGAADPETLMDTWTLSGGPNPAGEPFEFVLNPLSTTAMATISFTNYGTFWPIYEEVEING